MRFDHVQSLRFFGAFAVLLYHAGVYAEQRLGAVPFGGWLGVQLSWGVQLFFVISGFVLAYSLSRMGPGRFLAHRILRIYPPLWGLALLVWLYRGTADMSGAQFLQAMTLLPLGEIRYPLGVEWSLVYEVFFYGVMTLLACLPGRRTMEVAMLAWLAAIVVMDRLHPGASTAFLPRADQIVFSGFNVPFIFGVLCFSLFRATRRLPLALLLVVFLLALPAATAVAKTEYQLALQGLGFAALVLAAAEASRRRTGIGDALLVRLGDASYGLYLAHVPVLLWLLSALPAARLGSPEAVLLIAVPATFLLGTGYGMLEAAAYRRVKGWLDRGGRVRLASRNTSA
ncbi:acyltransferase family protein [Denitratisoma sp. DHT3]|uniref:acyltransferase family protein n=1 Tax=Denitratisoma sp. DHT3 TaxID=1981880 RepID=UPI0016493412|nr:acyltransferase [Denitratisoma sp. DHT3]